MCLFTGGAVAVVGKVKRARDITGHVAGSTAAVGEEGQGLQQALLGSRGRTTPLWRAVMEMKWAVELATKVLKQKSAVVVL